MNEEIRNKLISKLKICCDFVPSFDRSQRYGFLFGENKHSLIFEYINKKTIKIFHQWGPGDDIYYHKIIVDRLSYKKDEDITFTDSIGFRSNRVVNWLYSYSFINENLRLDWDEFFKNMDMFILKYI